MQFPLAVAHIRIWGFSSVFHVLLYAEPEMPLLELKEREDDIEPRKRGYFLTEGFLLPG